MQDLIPHQFMHCKKKLLTLSYFLYSLRIYQKAIIGAIMRILHAPICYKQLYVYEGAMLTLKSKVTSKGQIVIPKKIREKYGIGPLTSIHWVEKEEGVLMVPDSEDPIIAARGMFKGSGILKAYLEEKKREKAKEDKKAHAR